MKYVIVWNRVYYKQDRIFLNFDKYAYRIGRGPDSLRVLNWSDISSQASKFTEKELQAVDFWNKRLGIFLHTKIAGVDPLNRSYTDTFRCIKEDIWLVQEVLNC